DSQLDVASLWNVLCRAFDECMGEFLVELLAASLSDALARNWRKLCGKCGRPNDRHAWSSCHNSTGEHYSRRWRAGSARALGCGRCCRGVRHCPGGEFLGQRAEKRTNP